jgi:NAD(P)-dependent dehydrogenase (short-subunit alcohol dehydrogenase family)
LENQDAGITFNVILPGTLDTLVSRGAVSEADPAKWIDPRDLAKVALMAGTDGASMITGPLYRFRQYRRIWRKKRKGLAALPVRRKNCLP